MTVCAAAIAERSIVIGVSDRMLTAGDIEFQPAQSKIWSFTSNILGLIAGDFTVQAEICKDVQSDVQAWLKAKPDEYVAVKDVVRSYTKHYRQRLQVLAEDELLRPLGLDMKSIFTSSVQGDVLASLAERLQHFDFPSPCESIIAGVDADGFKGPNGEDYLIPHIYVTEGARSACYDAVGFAAIGGGKSHAESQFMFSGHWPEKKFDETLLLTYSAKKRAEVAPGVGEDTDLVMVGPAFNTMYKMPDEDLEGLRKIYLKSRREEDAVVLRAKEAASKYVAAVRAKNLAKQAAANPQAADQTEKPPQTS